jgi:hypothetical protein
MSPRFGLRRRTAVGPAPAGLTEPTGPAVADSVEPTEVARSDEADEADKASAGDVADAAGLVRLSRYRRAVLSWVAEDAYPVNVYVEIEVKPGEGVVRFSEPPGFKVAAGSIVAITGSHVHPLPGGGFDERRHVTVWGVATARPRGRGTNATCRCRPPMSAVCPGRAATSRPSPRSAASRFVRGYRQVCCSFGRPGRHS